MQQISSKSAGNGLENIPIEALEELLMKVSFVFIGINNRSIRVYTAFNKAFKTLESRKDLKEILSSEVIEAI